MQGRDDASESEQELEQPGGAARRTDHLPGSESAAHDAPVNPGWRSDRSGTTKRRVSARRTAARGQRVSAPRMPRLGPLPTFGAVPTTRADLSRWLQQGGWRWLALAGGLLVLLLVIGALRGQATTTASEEPLDTTGTSIALLAQPTVTPSLVEPTAPPLPQAQAFVVANTGTDGLILRAGPGTDQEQLKSLPDGTPLEALGEEQEAGGYTWLRVRDPEGVEGWVARDFLTPAS